MSKYKVLSRTDDESLKLHSEEFNSVHDAVKFGITIGDPNFTVVSVIDWVATEPNSIKQNIHLPFTPARGGWMETTTTTTLPTIRGSKNELK